MRGVTVKQCVSIGVATERDRLFHPVFACTFFQRMKGLLGRDAGWLGRKGVLVLAPCRHIHTYGMGHALDVAFVGMDGVVLRSIEGLPPCSSASCPGAYLVLERFSADEDSGEIPSWFRRGERLCLCVK